MKISFDFDSCLGEERQQKLCRKLMDAGHEIYITTTRPELLKDQIKLENRDLWKVVNDLGIKHENVRFTNGTGKYHFLHDFDIHFDDDRIEIELIEEHLTTCVGVLIFDP